MTLAILTYPLFRALDANGAPLAGGKLYSYLAGTSTPQALYAADGVTPLSNPVVLDSAGQAAIRLGSSAYKLNLTDAAGVQQSGFPVDNVTRLLESTLVAGASDTLGAMQTQTDPGDEGSESRATTLAGEVERLRWELADGLGRRYWDSQGPVVHVESPRFGAIGDATTDDTAAIQAAVDSLAATGGTVQFGPKTYKVTTQIVIPYNNIRLVGCGWQSTLKMASGGSLNSVLGVLTFGLDADTNEVAISGCVVADPPLDPNDLCKPLYVRVTSLSFFNRLLCENSKRSLAFFLSCHSCYLTHSYLTDSNAPDAFGDGIYMENCSDMRVLFNHIYDFKRLGIVSEGSGGSVSLNPLIVGNHVQYAHDASGAEHNGGIWIQDTDGARIIGNNVADLYNTPGANAVHGITINGGQDSTCLFQMTDNVISGVYSGSTTPYGLGINVAGDPTYANVVITGNEVLGPYVYGLYIAKCRDLHLEANHFGPNPFAVGGACVLIDASGNSCGRVYVGPNHKGTQTYSVAHAADFTLSDDGSGITSLTLAGLKGWKVNISTLPDLLYIADCDLTVDSGSSFSYGIGALRLEVTNTRITDTHGSFGSLKAIRPLAGSVMLFNACTLVNCLMQVGASVATAVHFNDTIFSGCQLDTNANANLYFRGCTIGSYPTTGFLRGATAAGALNIYGWDCIVTQGADNTPFVKTSVDADNFAFYNTLVDSAITTFSTFTSSISGFAAVNTP